MDAFLSVRMPEIQAMNKLLVWLVTEEERLKLKREEDEERGRAMAQRQQLMRRRQHGRGLRLRFPGHPAARLEVAQHKRRAQGLEGRVHLCT